MIYKTRGDFVIKNIKKIETNKIILDVGFLGQKEPFMHYKILNLLNENDHLVGIDTNKEKLDLFINNEKTKDLVKKYYVSYRFKSIFSTDFKDGEFNCVCLMEVFEHLYNPYNVFDEIRRLIKPGGIFIMTYPNPLNLNIFLKYVIKKNILNQDFLNYFRGDREHKIFPHPVCLANYLNNLGFKVEEVGFIKYNIKYFSRINYLLAKFGITTKFSNYVGICARKL